MKFCSKDDLGWVGRIHQSTSVDTGVYMCLLVAPCIYMYVHVHIRTSPVHDILFVRVPAVRFLT